MKTLLKSLVFTTLIVLLLISCSSKNDEDIIVDTEFTLQAGNYTGLWNSTADVTYTNVPISAKITEVSSGEFEGEFFITSNFTSCCNSGSNDGTISFKINKHILSHFEYNDIIPNCNGLFTGSGKLIADNSILINITGTDCDGSHTGTIALSK